MDAKVWRFDPLVGDSVVERLAQMKGQVMKERIRVERKVLQEKTPGHPVTPRNHGKRIAEQERGRT